MCAQSHIIQYECKEHSCKDCNAILQEVRLHLNKGEVTHW